MNDRFEFVFVSSDEKFSLDRQYTDEITKAYPNAVFNYVANNTHSLGFVYNTFIKMHREKHDIDHLVFMHADVKLDIVELMKHVSSAADKYDVLGLCGCAKLSTKHSPLNWYTASREFPNFRWGYVSHGELGNQEAYFSSHSPATTDHEVGCIDGLCIILNPTALYSSDILFDERFQFNHYDTDFSFQCVFNKKLKLGVIVRKDLQHWSVGKSILRPEFMTTETIFREKWNLNQAASQK